MTIKKIFSQVPKLTTLAISLSLLSACGSDSITEETDPIIPPTSERENPEVCTQATGSTVNQAALLTAFCNNLSDYNLFSDATDPTTGPNGRGIPFDLNTPLYTDYASKYRFVFVPDGETATYNEHEVMDFPVGTVLVKTFALPDDTSNREGAETIIETRLLINRETGWVALPYYWDKDNDASYLIGGEIIPVSLVHKGETISFDYGIPQKTQCTQCHSIIPGPNTDEIFSVFKPIGPKARFLNNVYDYESGSENQLTYWENQNILTGAPADKTTITTASTFTDNIDPTTLSDVELNLHARSYLDINCAHCHRSELTVSEAGYTGAAGRSGLHLEFNRDFDEADAKFGVCKGPAAGGYTDPSGKKYIYDVVPGYPDESYLAFRMDTNIARQRMPELGRSTIHTEGVALIKEWIDRMPANSCGIEGL